LKKRFDAIDFWKAIAAFLVVAIHCPFPGLLGEIFVNIGRIAVPFFFMVSGFFCYSQDSEENKKKAIKQIKYLLKLTLFVSLIYILKNIMFSYINGEAVEFLHHFISKKHIWSFILFNKTESGSHLWYMYALIYSLIIISLLCRFKIRIRNIVICIIVFLGVDLIFGTYSVAIFGIKLPTEYTRNFLFCGLPYFMSGRIIRMAYEKELLNQISRNKMIILFVFGVLLGLAEEFLLQKNGLTSNRKHYFGTTVAVIALFLFLITSNGNIGNVIKKLGREYSKEIYLWHPMVYFFTGYIIRFFDGIARVYYILLPIIVFTETTFLVYLMREINRKFKRNYTNYKRRE